MVRSTSGLRSSSWARWKPYSFNWRPLGGNAVTRQIFIGSILEIDSLEQADAKERLEQLILPTRKIEKALLLQARGKTQRIVHRQPAAVIFQGAPNWHGIRNA